MSSPMAQFLSRILPSSGWLCGANITAKTHVWAQNPTDLADKLITLDAGSNATYHACSSFKEPGERTQANVHSVKALWLDVDVGEDKPYKTIEEAIATAKLFCEVSKLPWPMVVNSGNGLHLYWVLKEEVSREVWEVYARGLKKLCKEKGFATDPSRTSDAASILRPPGTTNRKGAPKPVVWVSDAEPCDITVFPRYEKPTRSALASSLTNIGSGPPANASQMADLCAQIGYFREVGGSMPEPEWKACLGSVAFCADGPATAHEWSQGDPRYSEPQTESKIQASLAMTGPTTCAHFQDLNDRCQACPFKGQITSPVELGRGAPKMSTEQILFAQEVSAEMELPTVGLFTHVGGALVFKSESKEGREVYTRITQYPVIIEAVMKGELTVDNYSVVLKHKSPHEPWQSSTIALKTLFGASGISEVMGKGITVHQGELFKQYVRESMDQINAKQRAQVQYDQFGWKNDETAFLVGDRLYTAKGYSLVTGGKEVARRSAGLGPAKNGSLEVWRDCINKLFAQGFEAQGFAVLASFSAPFMRWQSHSEGGAIISLVSREGGKGKSTALAAAASVWGKLDAMSQITADTRVAKGIGLGVMGNLPMIRDEYTQRDPEILREEVEIFTAGRDKQRGNADGTLVNLGAGWQTLLIAGSNNSLVDILSAGRNGHAMAGRVVEFLVDIPKGAAHWKGDQLKDMIVANSGYAGEAFIQAILQEGMLDYLKDTVPKVREDIIRKNNLTSDRRFIARTLAGVAVAGAIVRHMGLIDMSIDRIMSWAQDMLFHDGFGRIDKRDEPSHILARFLSDNLQSTLIMPDAFKLRSKQPPLQKPTRCLVIRHEVKPGKIYIDRRALRMWMQRNEYPWRPFVDDLVDQCIVLNPEKTFTLSAGTDMTTGQVICLEIDANHPLFIGGVREVEKEKQEREG